MLEEFENGTLQFHKTPHGRHIVDFSPLPIYGSTSILTVCRLAPRRPCRLLSCFSSAPIIIHRFALLTYYHHLLPFTLLFLVVAISASQWLAPL